ncbi:MAG TPA: hypothetical protein VLM75_10415 [Spirochaetota bacterium]|nr:hypothetical protein [Spirochaetota bacterium]
MESTIAILLVLGVTPAFAARPIAAMAGIEAKSPRGARIAEMLAESLSAALRSSGAFEQIYRHLLADQLSRYGCDAEACIIRFARTAGVSLLLHGRVDDRGSALTIEIEAYGIDAPYFGKMLYRYRAELFQGTAVLGARELSLICEEHAVLALAGALSRFMLSVPLIEDGRGGFPVPGDAGVSAGEYELFRPARTSPEDDVVYTVETAGRVRIDENGRVTGIGPATPRAGDYILTGFQDEAARMADLHRARKEETVFQNPGYSDPILAAIFSVPASASMPIMAPLGYYHYGDFEGLSLWAVNAAPWLYLEASGLLRRPKDLRSDKRDVPRETAARYNFGLYMLCAGGLPLFVDAFAHQYLRDASLYQGTQPVIGGNPTAVFLSMVSGGGGHFYKGHRFWGYIYFHLNNALVYSVLREYSSAQRYDAGTDSYRKSKGDTGRLRVYLGALGAVKIIEVAHVLSVGHSISAGRVHEERFSMAPELLFDKGNITPGVRVTYRF